jgi:hypothetical protein
MLCAHEGFVDLKTMSEEIRVVMCLVQDCVASGVSQRTRVPLPHAVRPGRLGGVVEASSNAYLQ